MTKICMLIFLQNYFYRSNTFFTNFDNEKDNYLWYNQNDQNMYVNIFGRLDKL